MVITASTISAGAAQPKGIVSPQGPVAEPHQEMRPVRRLGVALERANSRALMERAQGNAHRSGRSSEDSAHELYSFTPARLRSAMALAWASASNSLAFIWPEITRLMAWLICALTCG